MLVCGISEKKTCWIPLHASRRRIFSLFAAFPYFGPLFREAIEIYENNLVNRSITISLTQPLSVLDRAWVTRKIYPPVAVKYVQEGADKNT